MNVPLIIGSITLAVTVIAAIGAWTARETHRIPLDDLGHDTVPMAKSEYELLRSRTVDAEGKAGRFGSAVL